MESVLINTATDTHNSVCLSWMRYGSGIHYKNEQERRRRENKKVKYKIKLEKGGIIPLYAHEEDAGCDLFAPIGCNGILKPGCGIIIDTMVRIFIPKGYCGKIESKSGLFFNHGIISEGLIDSGFTGTIKVKLINLGHEPYKIEGGQKISQIVFQKCEHVEFEIVDEIPDTDRGENGYGSTGL